MNIRPLHDRVVIERVEAESKTESGIIIPDNAKEKPLRGRVIAIGNGKVLADGTLRPLDVKAGDEVLFTKYAGNEVKLGGKDVVVLREDDVLGIIER